MHPAQADWIQSVVDQYQRRLILYACRLLTDPEEAQDVVQDAFLQLCKQPRQAVEPHLARWLYTVCRNSAIDRRRKGGRMLPLTVAHDQQREQSPHASLEHSESASLMQRALAGLPENQQEVIRLKFQHDHSYAEISAITGLSVSNVGFLLHVGLKAVRERMSSHAEPIVMKGTP